MDLLAPGPGEVAVDCTAGRGGHSVLLARAVAPGGRVIGFDVDPENLEYAAARVEEAGGNFCAFRRSFVTAAATLEKMDARADVLVADLGFSSNQMDDPERGLSFRADGALDMRLDPSAETTAATLLATLGERELADVIYRYGEEPLARKIARFLVERRQRQPIQTTAELAGLVLEAYGARGRHSRMHPATRTFMALRIAVNDELNALEALLSDIERGAERAEEGGWLNAGSRIAIISFHSLEDRLVKHAFADLAKRGKAVRLTKRPVTAGAQEVQANARARSAKLRVIRLGA
jgi:16S rRNA (cytosine1402-N4)-methyltransferase